MWSFYEFYHRLKNEMAFDPNKIAGLKSQLKKQPPAQPAEPPATPPPQAETPPAAPSGAPSLADRLKAKAKQKVAQAPAPEPEAPAPAETPAEAPAPNRPSLADRLKGRPQTGAIQAEPVPEDDAGVKAPPKKKRVPTGRDGKPLSPEQIAAMEDRKLEKLRMLRYTVDAEKLDQVLARRGIQFINPETQEPGSVLDYATASGKKPMVVLDRPGEPEEYHPDYFQVPTKDMDTFAKVVQAAQRKGLRPDKKAGQEWQKALYDPDKGDRKGRKVMDAKRLEELEQSLDDREKPVWDMVFRVLPAGKIVPVHNLSVIVAKKMLQGGLDARVDIDDIKGVLLSIAAKDRQRKGQKLKSGGMLHNKPILTFYDLDQKSAKGAVRPLSKTSDLASVANLGVKIPEQHEEEDYGLASEVPHGAGDPRAQANAPSRGFAGMQIPTQLQIELDGIKKALLAGDIDQAGPIIQKVVGRAQGPSTWSKMKEELEDSEEIAANPDALEILQMFDDDIQKSKMMRRENTEETEWMEFYNIMENYAK